MDKLRREPLLRNLEDLIEANELSYRYLPGRSGVGSVVVALVQKIRLPASLWCFSNIGFEAICGFIKVKRLPIV